MDHADTDPSQHSDATPESARRNAENVAGTSDTTHAFTDKNNCKWLSEMWLIVSIIVHCTSGLGVSIRVRVLCVMTTAQRVTYKQFKYWTPKAVYVYIIKAIFPLFVPPKIMVINVLNNSESFFNAIDKF